MTDDYTSVLTLPAENIGFSATGSRKQKKEHQLSLGSYPEISLKTASIHRDEIQTAGAKGQSPALKSHKTPQIFSDVAAEWITVRMNNKVENYLRTVHFRLNKYILPALGSLPLKDITSGLILQVCRNIEATGHEDPAKRVKTVIGQIFRYAIAAGYADTEPTSALLGALCPRSNQHYSTLTAPADIAILMKAIQVK